jgi:hypothetical protein
MTTKNWNRLKKGLLWILSAIVLAIISILIEKFIDNWWNSEPTPPPPKPSVSNNNRPSSELPKPSDQTQKPHRVTDCNNIPPEDIITQLKCLKNPQAPFTISLWLDERGKKHFTRDQKATFGYEINGLKPGTRVYFTLLNISPSGQLSLILDEIIEAEKTYGQLTEQLNVAIVKQIQLEAGQEYFKAIGTLNPINWQTIIKAATKPPATRWGTVELTVTVD